MNINVYRNDEIILNLPLTEDATYTHNLMNEHTIKISLDPSHTYDLQIGDYVEYNSERFTINVVPDLDKESDVSFRYGVTFEGQVYDLYNKVLRHTGRSDFNYYGNAEMCLQLIVDNMNEIDPAEGWSIGFIDETKEQHLIISSNTSCRVALTNFCEAFGMEFYLSGKAISMVKSAGFLTTINLQYGRGNGMYNLTRRAVQDKNVATKFYGMGSTRNLPLDYRGGLSRLSFDPGFILQNDDIFGIKEYEYVNEEIYPRFEGSVTQVGAFNESARTFTIKCPTIDFNVSDAIVTDIDGLVHFRTGDLAGSDFVITGWDNTNKVVTLFENTTNPVQKLPNDVFVAQVGDTFTFLDIAMPESYIEDAEAEIQAATEDFADENSVPRVAYSLNVNLLWARDNGISFKPGDRVTITDTHFGIVNMPIRISGVSHSLNFPTVVSNATRYEIVIADFVPYTTTERAIADSIDTRNIIKIVDRTNVERARQNVAQTRQLKSLIFNPDGSLADTIKAGFIEVGFESQNFVLNNVTIKPNYGGDPNSLEISEGELIHLEVEIDGLGYVWQMEPELFEDLDPELSYYVYAQCSKTSLTGVWKVSTDPVFVDQDTGQYNFNLGVLYPVVILGTPPYRNFNSTNGVTFIVGNTITTGTIQSQDGLNYFDLTQGKFKIGTGTSGLSYNVEEPDTLVVRGKIIAGPGSNIPGTEVVEALQDEVDAAAAAAAAAVTTANAASTAASTATTTANSASTNATAAAATAAAAASTASAANSAAAAADLKAIAAQEEAEAAAAAAAAAQSTGSDAGLNAIAAQEAAEAATAAAAAAATTGTAASAAATAAAAQATAAQAEAAAAAADATAAVTEAAEANQNAQDAIDAAAAATTAAGNADLNAAAAGTAAAAATAQAEAAQSAADAADAQAAAASATANAADSAAAAAAADALAASLAASGATTEATAAAAAAATAHTAANAAQTDADTANAAAAAAQASANAAAAAAAAAAATAATALANANNAITTANAAAAVTSFLFTTIDGNLIATGTLLLGDATGNNAGITGVKANGAQSVFLWGGATYANRQTAPMRLTQEGKIFATAGVLGGWTLLSDRMESGAENDNYIGIISGTNPYIFMHNNQQPTGQYSKMDSKSIFISSNGVVSPYNVNVAAIASFMVNPYTEDGTVHTAIYAKAPDNGTAIYADGYVLLNKGLTVNSGTVGTILNGFVTLQAEVDFTNAVIKLPASLPITASASSVYRYLLFNVNTRRIYRT